jgi:hypothetical protein
MIKYTASKTKENDQINIFNEISVCFFVVFFEIVTNKYVALQSTSKIAKNTK